MMHTSGLLRVTDVHKEQRCVVVNMLDVKCHGRSADSTLTCFRGFRHHGMTRLVQHYHHKQQHYHHIHHHYCHHKQQHHQ